MCSSCRVVDALTVTSNRVKWNLLLLVLIFSSFTAAMISKFVFFFKCVVLLQNSNSSGQVSSLERHTCVILNSVRHNEPTQNKINKWCPLKLLHAYLALNAVDSPNTSAESAAVTISSVDNNHNLYIYIFFLNSRPISGEKRQPTHWCSSITSSTVKKWGPIL